MNNIDPVNCHNKVVMLENGEIGIIVGPYLTSWTDETETYEGVTLNNAYWKANINDFKLLANDIEEYNKGIFYHPV